MMDIHLLYRSKFIHIALWAYVTRARNHGEKINEAIEEFKDYMNLQNIPTETLKMAYFRMQKRFMQCQRSQPNYQHFEQEFVSFIRFIDHESKTKTQR